MIILQVRGLEKSFGVKTIFKEVGFTIQQGEKVGLVGPNGAGKTTLLRCLINGEFLDAGEVAVGEGVKIGYLEQIPQYSSGVTLFEVMMEAFADIFVMKSRLRKLEQEMAQTVGVKLEQIMKSYSMVMEEYERAGGFSCESMARKIAFGLGFTEKDLEREVHSFSGGEKTRAGLVRLLVRKPDLLFLDEPTNHLDLEALEWLEGYLKNYEGAVILISHDRYFLDQITTRTWELQDGKLEIFPGNYTRYLLLKEEKVEALRKSFTKQQQEIKKTEEYINKYRAGIKSKQARGRQLQLDRMARIESPARHEKIKLKVGGREVAESANIVLRVSALVLAFKQKRLFQNIGLEIRRKEKVALIGVNGVGKSTFLKVIMGQLEAEQGVIELGSRVKIGYYDQEHAGLEKDYHVIDELMYNFDITEQEARDKLAAFLFRGDDVYKKVAELSGGEKGRLSFLKMILKRPNFLILDEPTNHLDISSRTVIEQYLKDFGGTILAVSHDRYFLDLISTRVLELKDGCLHDYAGNYTYYKEKKAAAELREAEEKKSERKEKVNKGAEERKQKVNKAKTREQIAALEQQIEGMEERFHELEVMLADAATYQNETEIKAVLDEYKTLEKNIPRLYGEWEELMQLL